MRIRAVVGAALAALLTSSVADAQEKKSFSLFIDQDVLWPPSFDQDFTMGLMLSWGGGDLNCSKRRGLIRTIDRLFRDKVSLCFDDGPADLNAFERVSFGVGDSAFTPAKGRLASSAPIPWDRPYANLLFASVKRDVTWSKPAKEGGIDVSVPDRYARTTELTFGVLGLGIGEAAQKWIHRHISQDVAPGGWRHQISNGGEPTLRYRRTDRFLLADRTTLDGSRDVRRARRFDLQALIDTSAGYYTKASAGLQFRWAPFSFMRIESPWWQFDASPNPNTRAPEPGTDQRDWEFFVTGGFKGEAWLYNGLMQGQFRDSEVTLNFKDERPGISTLNRALGEFNVAATVRVKTFSLSYAVTQHSALFRGTDPQGAPTARTHNWGGLYLSWRSSQ